MARFFAFFTLFHLSLTVFRPEVPFNGSLQYIQTVRVNVFFNLSILAAALRSTSSSGSNHSSSYSPILFLFSWNALPTPRSLNPNSLAASPIEVNVLVSPSGVLVM